MTDPTDWREIFKSRLTEPEEAFHRVRGGGRIFIGTGAAEPTHLVRTLADRVRGVVDAELMHVWSLGGSIYLDEETADRFRLNTFYPVAFTAEALRQGRVDYTPAFLSQIPEMFRSRLIHLDVALIQVTPPDSHGYVSCGVSVDVTRAAAESADLTIAQVNPRMPRTHGDSFLHVSQIDAFVRHSEKLPETEPEPGTEIHQEIGRYVAQLIPDGATVHLGIGPMPRAGLAHLKDRRDLGVHTEFFSDWLQTLMEAGIINNRRKTINPGKVVAAFCMGTRKLYDFIDDNPSVELHPSDYVNDPSVIARHELMVSINNAYQVDLTGQINTDWPLHRFYIGPEGQADFIRGAARSPGGRPVVTLSSMTEDGSESRIVSSLPRGSGVSLARADVHYVVTEYGIAALKGKSLRDRALSLIDIAHPEVRTELLNDAKQRRYVYPDQLPPAVTHTDPSALTTQIRLKDRKTEATLRPVRATDEHMVQELFHGLSAQDRYFRFFTSIQALPHRLAQKLCHTNYRDEMAIVAVVPRGKGEKVVGTGQYILDKRTNLAEIALMVREDHQNLGIGTALLDHLIRLARAQDIRGLQAQVLPGNRPMLEVLKKRKLLTHTRLRDGALEMVVVFDEVKPRTPSV